MPQKSAPRTKTGCANCRRRRIKCDETRPACRRCLFSGWTCRWYNHQAAHTQTAATNCATTFAESRWSCAFSTRNQPRGVLAITEYNLPYKVPGSQSERKALHFFTIYAAAELGGYLPSDFWTRIVPRRCQHEVAVRRAATSLSQMYEEYTTTSELVRFAPTEEAIEGYSKAFKALRRYIDCGERSPDMAVVLMCCAMFYCIDLLQNDNTGALRHLHSGISMLNNTLASGVADYYNNAGEDLREVAQVFARMDLSATVYNDYRTPALMLDSQHRDPLLRKDWQPNRFGTLVEANQSLTQLLLQAFQFLVPNTIYKTRPIVDIPPEVVRRKWELEQSFECWEEKLDAYQQEISTQQFKQNDRLRVRNSKALATLRLHHRAVQMLLKESLFDNPGERASTFDVEAEDLLQLAQALVQTLLATQDGPSAELRQFSSDMGVVPPLSLLIVKTTNVKVRQKSLSVLYAVQKRREGMYDAHESAAFLSKMLQCSEMQASESFHSKRSPAERTANIALEWTLEDVRNGMEDSAIGLGQLIVAMAES